MSDSLEDPIDDGKDCSPEVMRTYFNENVHDDLNSSGLTSNSVNAKLTKKKRDASTLRKAPQAPKRFKSSYILFFMAKQEEIKQNLGPGASVGEVSKKSSQLWKSLSQEERQKWDEKARKDKERYMIEKAKYTGPWQVPYKRNKKDPSAPKRPMSAFLFFSQDKRRKIKEENGGIRNTEVSRVLGEMWKNASDEERKPHIEREARERAKYKTEMATWRKNEEERKVKEKKMKDDEIHYIQTTADSQPSIKSDPYGNTKSLDMRKNFLHQDMQLRSQLAPPNVASHGYLPTGRYGEASHSYDNPSFSYGRHLNSYEQARIPGSYYGLEAMGSHIHSPVTADTGSAQHAYSYPPNWQQFSNRVVSSREVNNSPISQQQRYNRQMQQNQNSYGSYPRFDASYEYAPDPQASAFSNDYDPYPPHH
mmetsp:Transcript_7210/g.10329  ORF Transcript_7210/g.10329 Transcript_7210/m.10329 type:complete len:421 (-) Transcript_7210:305-1567(-)|eukprot:CAMPEP_0184858008 /NCGR_PEP_ID=MMETSP0580-20130426/3141_1 /TAXON_ID=1118495 /ORGANISM="Dactyliosolen fragilissimus" /LENGTH=420 /DNA_ID=CAMNT_0027353923 /DNA_START=172 /DNA_END=1434 /DNA_ORIENTATION=+